MEEFSNVSPEIQALVKKAAVILPLKIKKQKLKEVHEILSSEFPVDFPVTDTNLSSLSYACSITAFEGEASDQDK